MLKRISLLLVMAASSWGLWGQELTQTIRGKVIDEVSEIPLPGASVMLLNRDPLLGGSTDLEGNFRIENVPLGRYAVQISHVGYETVTTQDIIVHSGKSNFIKVKLKESSILISEFVIQAPTSKEMPLNDMATVSARPFTIEETRRYAGGLDDPARMATAFAGVTSNSLGQNSIIIRGNAPKGVQWRMEGIEIPSPSHFAGATIAGGGFVTLLSNQVLDNSDFMTGSFPAEYGNALSGVFDMNLRSGNNEKHEHTFQAGLIGLDLASEGPLSKRGESSYLFNYRYSTLGLIQPILPDNSNTINYQDLSFKLNFPTKAGEFSFWGVGGKDFGQKNEALIMDTSLWETEEDFKDYEYGFNLGATGLTHKINLGDKSLLKTSVAASMNDSYWYEDRLDPDLNLNPYHRVDNFTGTFSISSQLNQKVSRKVTSRSGVLLHRHFYNLDIKAADHTNEPMRTIVEAAGSVSRAQVFSQVRYRINPAFSTNLGFHSQYFELNDQLTLEPRASFSWHMDPFRSLSLGYGNHSQMEDAKIYFVQAADNRLPNKDLKLSRAHHLVLSYDWVIREGLRFKAEPYYQLLYDVPVIADSSFSMLNFEQDWFFDKALVNSGEGRNYGLDLTVERFLNNNFYYLVTGSLFESKYQGGDGIWRNTRFNRGYSFDILGGKEWQTGAGGNRWWGVNARLNLMGGKRMSPVDEAASLEAREPVFDEYSAFRDQETEVYYFDLSITYRKNKPKHSSVWALQVKNILGSPDFDGYEYNFKSRTIEATESVVVIPSLSYKIEF